MTPYRGPISESVKVPPECRDLAHRRTEYLFHNMRFSDISVRDVLASAYLQGMADCLQTVESRHDAIMAILSHPGARNG